MGNAGQPRKTGKHYEVKPQYEGRTKQLNIQHDTNQCYEHMRAVQRKAVDMFTLKLLRAAQFVPFFFNLPNRFLKRHGQQQFKPTTLEASTTISTQNSQKLKSVTGVNYKNKVQNDKECSPKRSKEPKAESAQQERARSNFGITQLVAPSFQTGISQKSKSQEVQRHQNRQKQRLDAMGIGD
ncbi:hypothetical protein F511_24674 [Dorcoceras hygrometricum]|uniref:Uncharacterized protein n=1 Tax=Dorcoceras hygrometricum TaxID=472368 RepID=A0A2Z7D8K0_9LAMI|nr:hypothetical protein F511_24674 [Dorcoceras hygrometricum]